MRNTLRYLVVLVSSEVYNLRYLPLIQSLHKLIDVVFSRNWARTASEKATCEERKNRLI